MENKKAQGTIEYLVTVAIIIVVALVITIILLNLNSTTAPLVGNYFNRVESSTTGQISVIESAIDSEGDGVISLQTLGNDIVTLDEVTLTSDPNTTFTFEQENNNGTFLVYVNDINSICSCDESGKIVSCNLTLYFTKTNGLTTIVKVQKAICKSDVNSPIYDPESIAPTVTLSSPADDASSATQTVDFNFTVSDTSPISRCELFINGVSDTNKTTGLVNGTNTIQKTFSTDKLADWSISCYDLFSNRGNSTTTRTLDVDASTTEITTCLELQEINNDPTNDFALMNNINCAETSGWLSGIPTAKENKIYFVGGGGPPVTYYHGFVPLTLSGTLEGNGYLIQNLYTAQNGGRGLFGTIEEGGVVRNLGLTGANIQAISYSGTIAAINNGTISNVYASGTLSRGCGAQYCAMTSVDLGGLVYSNYGTITDSYSTVTVSVGENNVGGLVAINQASGVITNSYSRGAVSGTGTNGGLVGTNLGTIENSFTTSSVTNGNGFVGSNSGTLTTNYWDITRTTKSSGGCTAPNCNGVNLASAEPSYFYSTSNAPLASWDFDTVWDICEGQSYPTLQWENRTC